jgi:ATP/ADP translocase
MFCSSAMVVLCTFWILVVAYSLKARIVESQQLAIIRQRPINNNRGMVFSAQFVLMAGHATVEYIMPSLSSNCTVTEEWCFLHGLC